jgi:hypothetical protein
MKEVRNGHALPRWSSTVWEGGEPHPSFRKGSGLEMRRAAGWWATKGEVVDHLVASPGC